MARRKDQVIGLLVLTHGRFSEELVDAARTVVPGLKHIEALSIDWNLDSDEAAGQIRDAIGRVDPGDGVLLLTDMFGGTPTNLALSMLEPGKVEIVTGVNLPMVIKFANLASDRGLTEVARSVAEQGRESIQVAAELLGPAAETEAEARDDTAES